MQKSKREIIEETKAFYNLTNRATGDYGVCHYSINGRQCAVGRCLKPDSKVFHMTGAVMNVVNKLRDAMEEKFFAIEDYLREHVNPAFDSELQEEYRGHAVIFWDKIQQWHDTPGNWSKTGLSEEGEAYYHWLIDKYGSL